VLGLVAFFGFRAWFIERAHFLAAAGLLACIVLRDVRREHVGVVAGGRVRR
jgi:hypothetical protein